MLGRRGNAEYHSYGSVFEGIASEDIFQKHAISRSGGKAIVDEEGRQVASRGRVVPESWGEAGERAPESGRGGTWRGAVGPMRASASREKRVGMEVKLQ